LFQPLPARLRKTLTLDNGKEFAEHEQLAATTALRVYFAKPYCAWQRGTNENTNGLVRQFFPKGSDMAHVPAKQFEKVQHLLNNRPRRRLGYAFPVILHGTPASISASLPNVVYSLCVGKGHAGTAC
jgi:transposase, IS30 family